MVSCAYLRAEGRIDAGLLGGGYEQNPTTGYWQKVTVTHHKKVAVKKHQAEESDSDCGCE